MPGDGRGGRGRNRIAHWRVKAGNREVFDAEKKIDCVNFVRDNPKVNGQKTRLVPPNR